MNFYLWENVGKFVGKTDFQVTKKPANPQVYWLLVSVPGFEPGTTWLKVKCSTNWATHPYEILFLMPSSGIEPETRGFSVLCSTNWANWALSCGSRIWTYDLRVMSPTSFQTAPSRDKCYLLKRRMGRGGFEPPKQVAADLQSVPFGHSGIHPYVKNIKLLYLLG